MFSSIQIRFPLSQKFRFLADLLLVLTETPGSMIRSYTPSAPGQVDIVPIFITVALNFIDV